MRNTRQIKKQFHTILFLFLLSPDSKAQNYLIYSDSNFVFKLKVDTVKKNGEAENCAVTSILVFGKNNQQTIQTIIPGDNYLCGMSGAERFVIEDMNFDGYNDIRMLSDMPFHYQNNPYYYWMYDKTKGVFIEDTIMRDLTSPEFDKGTKTITSYHMEGSEAYGNDTYKFVKGKLTLIESTDVTVYWDGKKNKTVTVTKKRIKGKMVVVSRKVETE